MNDDNIMGPWDGSEEYPFQFIQEGIDAADNGYKVFVYNGLYQENLIINKSISLNGENNAFTIIKGNNTRSVISIDAGTSIISDFTITTGKSVLIGIHVQTNFTTIKDNVIMNCEMNGVSLTNVKNTFISDNMFINDCIALDLKQSYNTIIKNNSFYNNFGGIDDHSIGKNIFSNNLFINNSYAAIQLESKIKDDIIENNTIIQNGHGITLSSSSNLVKHNIIINNTNFGIRLKGKKAIENIISDNKVIQNGDGGISLENAADNNYISNNYIENNQRFGGIYLLSTSDNYILNNTMRDNGITFEGQFKKNWMSHTIKNNTVNDKPLRYINGEKNVDTTGLTGQIILVNCRNCIIQELDISNASRGIQIAYSSNIDILNNNINHNEFGGIFIESSTGILIETNDLNKNVCGIVLQNTRTTKLVHNTISQSDMGLFINILFSPLYSLLRGFYLNKIIENNMINNTVHAYFINSCLNIWYHNYWDDYDGSGIKIIEGFWGDPLGAIMMDWYNFDLYPAQQPYNIDI